ncbi:MAG: DUF2334 domain-containing protein [Deltaproteobacteria bacterium]|nr:DUF2334 domain-containing protein [Deltaproteobacteria bacterium]
MNSRKYILFREDDISPFTRRDMVEKLYEDLFNAGHPVNFSVIPKMSTSITYDSNSPYSPYRHHMKMKFSPMIPPEYRGKNVESSFESNRDLLRLIRSLEAHIEIAQHGYDHNHVGKRNEFAIYDETRIRMKLEKGFRIIAQLFNGKPKFFVPPSDSASFVTIKALKENFEGISLWRFNLLKSVLGEIRRRFTLNVLRHNLNGLFKMRKIAKNVSRWDDFLILEHPGYIFSRFYTPEAMAHKFFDAFENNDIIIIVNHHWEYFFDWNGLDERFFEAWKKMIRYVLEREECRIVTFSKLHKDLCGPSPKGRL